ncbi:MAG: prepilin-type N-terminal cleavage/methylation domain-containing protein [Opitutaceae bacterium]
MSRTNPRPRRLPSSFPASRRTGFTLMEVLIAATISAVVLAGVLTSFLMMGRSGYNASNYSVMETEARRALETFSQEARMASNIAWSSATSVTFTVVNSTTTYTVTYAYDASTSGANARTFYRKLGDVSSSSPRLVLVWGVSEFAFQRYKVVNGVDYSAANDLETKQIQLTLRSVRTGVTTVATTNAVLSARVVLRNKVVST